MVAGNFYEHSSADSSVSPKSRSRNPNHHVLKNMSQNQNDSTNQPRNRSSSHQQNQDPFAILDSCDLVPGKPIINIQFEQLCQIIGVPNDQISKVRDANIYMHVADLCYRIPLPPHWSLCLKCLCWNSNSNLCGVSVLICVVQLGWNVCVEICRNACVEILLKCTCWNCVVM